MVGIYEAFLSGFTSALQDIKKEINILRTLYTGDSIDKLDVLEKKVDVLIEKKSHESFL